MRLYTIIISFIVRSIAIILIEWRQCGLVVAHLKLWWLLRFFSVRWRTYIISFSWVPRCRVDHYDIIFLIGVRHILVLWFKRVVLLLWDPAELAEWKWLAFLIGFIEWLFSAVFAEDWSQVTILGGTIELFTPLMLTAWAFDFDYLTFRLSNWWFLGFRFLRRSIKLTQHHLKLGCWFCFWFNLRSKLFLPLLLRLAVLFTTFLTSH